MTANLENNLEEMFTQYDSDFAIIYHHLFQDNKTALILRQYGYGFDDDVSRKIYIEGAEFNLCYVNSRRLRYNINLLYKLNIIDSYAKRFYEYDPHPSATYLIYLSEDAFNRLPPEVQKITKQAPFFNYAERYPKRKIISVNLHSRSGFPQKFIIVPNLAPFCSDHFVVFAENGGFGGLKQVYQPHGTLLYWIDDLFLQFQTSNYNLFFTPKGAGNTLDTLHFQLLKSSFPAFDSLDRHYNNNDTGLIYTNKNDWPFEGILARYTHETRDTVLASLETKIEYRLSNPENTFILLFHVRQDGLREFFFIFRKKGFNYISGIHNEIAGSETGGIIIVENKKEYESFPTETGKLELRKTA